MNGIRIVSTGSYVPERVITNDMFAETLDTSDEWIRSRTGMERRHFVTDEGNTDLAYHAAREAMDKGEISPDDIGIMIVATFSADSFVPSTACILQQRLGIAENTICFDLNAACSGFVYALETAKALLSGDRRRYALVIGSEVISKKIDMTDRSTCILFGDGAAAAIIEAAPGKMYMSSIGSRGDIDDLHCMVYPQTGQKICMNGKEIYRFAISTVPDMIKQTVAKAGLQLEDIDLFICHQANSRIIETIAKRLGIREERFYCRTGEYANTSAASIPLAVNDLNDKGELRPGMKIVLAGFGAGLTWGIVLMEI